MELNAAVARNIKAIRERKKLTLEAAARLTGVSRSMLAQMERGDANPSIAVLWKIANGYKTSFASLVALPQDDPVLIRGKENQLLQEDEGRYINRPAFPFQQDTHFETYQITIAPGGRLQAQPHMGGTEEFITVFSGQVEITAGEKQFTLGSGDSLRFRADMNHAYKNTGTQTACLHMLIHYADQ